jgi:hypothetical protein
METGSRLPYSQEPATCPYPGPAQSSPYPIPILEDPLILSSRSHLYNETIFWDVIIMTSR